MDGRHWPALEPGGAQALPARLQAAGGPAQRCSHGAAPRHGAAPSSWRWSRSPTCWPCCRLACCWASSVQPPSRRLLAVALDISRVKAEALAVPSLSACYCVVSLTSICNTWLQHRSGVPERGCVAKLHPRQRRACGAPDAPCMSCPLSMARKVAEGPSHSRGLVYIVMSTMHPWMLASTSRLAGLHTARHALLPLGPACRWAAGFMGYALGFSICSHACWWGLSGAVWGDTAGGPCLRRACRWVSIICSHACPTE